MKIYNVTRWMKVPMTIMVKGEEELEMVKAATDKMFCSIFAAYDRDERTLCEYGDNYESIGEQEVEFVDEEVSDEDTTERS